MKLIVLEGPLCVLKENADHFHWKHVACSPIMLLNNADLNPSARTTRMKCLTGIDSFEAGNG